MIFLKDSHFTHMAISLGMTYLAAFHLDGLWKLVAIPPGLYFGMLAGQLIIALIADAQLRYHNKKIRERQK